jgi:tetratricopeptide (TPR) repeat protein
MPARDDLSAQLQLASQLREAGRIADAIDAYERLLARWPDLPDSWFNLAYLERRAGRFGAAIRSYGQALARGVRQPEEVHVNRAVIFSDCLARPELARQELAMALAKNPSHVPAMLNLGNLHEDHGEREDAARMYERVLVIEPDNSLALARLPNVRPVCGATDPLIARLRGAMARPSVDDASLADLGFGLGKALDDAAAYDEAFDAYVTANQASQRLAYARGVRYEAAAQERLIDQLIATFAEPVRLDAAQASEPSPIFICGMFRSGSTLVEQILAAHPSVTAGGELDLLPALIRDLVGQQGMTPAAIDDRTLSMLRTRYLEGLSALFPGAHYVTDKRPDNFLHIGLIRKLFPAARIIHTRREPMDNCLSVYFLQLGHAAPYAVDLGDTAHWYCQYRRLMRHWGALHQDAIHDVFYDELVRDPRPVVGRLLEHCGLAWDASCLRFHRNTATVKTASVWQVRQPLYTRSSGRWQHYARHLTRLQSALDEESA